MKEIKNELHFRLLRETTMTRIVHGTEEKCVFETEDVDIMHELIRAIPAAWGFNGWIDGELRAPFRMIKDKTATADLWIELGDFDGGYPFTVSMDDRGKDLAPDICALLIDKRNPGYVRFDKAGRLGRNKRVTFEAAQRLAAYYVLRGYRGHLVFASGASKGNFAENPLRVDMELAPWDGAHPEVPAKQGGTLPPRIKLAWRPDLGGTFKNVEHVAHICWLHHLREYEVVGAGDFNRYQTQYQLPFEPTLQRPEMQDVPGPYKVAAE